MKKLILTINYNDIIIYLNNTKTAEDIINNLPHKVNLEMYDNREYYFSLDFKPSLEGEQIEDFVNGDVTYYPPFNTFAIFYARENESSCPGLIRIGGVASDLNVFKNLPDKVEAILKVE